MCQYCRVTRYKRKRKRIFKRRTAIISVLVFLFVLILVHLNLNVNPLIVSVSKGEISAKITQEFSLAAKEELEKNYSYKDFVEISKDNAGNIALIQTNNILINVLSRNISLSAQEKIDNLDTEFKVPVGAFSGFKIFSGFGALVNVNIQSVGTVKTDFLSEFSSAGINQTLHRIYLDVSIEVLLVLPGKNHSFNITNSIILCENVIIGQIPNIYFGGTK